MSASPAMFLVPITGPKTATLKLVAGPQGLVIGRSEECDLPLPLANAERVSRRHARFDFHGGQWRLSELGSRWGTFVNGVRVEPSIGVSLKQGDLIRIAPWTFLFTDSDQQGTQGQADLSRTTI